MIWKIIIKLLKCQNRKYIRSVSIKDSIYIIDIHKFIPIGDEVRQWENALKK